MSPMAANRFAPSSESPGVVSRAVSAWTAITETWCATTSCSSRAMRARSSMTTWSRCVSAIASRVASRSAIAWLRCRRESPRTCAPTASTSRRRRSSEPSSPAGESAATKNGSTSSTDQRRR